MGECLLLTTCGWISIALICSIDSVLAQVFIGSVVVEKSAAMAYLNTACLNADGGTEKGVWRENLRALELAGLRPVEGPQSPYLLLNESQFVDTTKDRSGHTLVSAGNYDISHI